jgi:hypothetical protein
MRISDQTPYSHGPPGVSHLCRAQCLVRITQPDRYRQRIQSLARSGHDHVDSPESPAGKRDAASSASRSACRARCAAHDSTGRHPAHEEHLPRGAKTKHRMHEPVPVMQVKQNDFGAGL